MTDPFQVEARSREFRRIFRSLTGQVDQVSVALLGTGTGKTRGRGRLARRLKGRFKVALIGITRRTEDGLFYRG